MNTYSRRGGRPETRILTLHFENNRLIAMEGNYLDEEDLASQALKDLQEGDDATHSGSRHPAASGIRSPDPGT
jgi:outer membrane protein assembly factor BamE